MFARGARNPFGLRFNPVNSSLWLTAVGDGHEQIFLIPSGGNIGWPTENNTSTESNTSTGCQHPTTEPLGSNKGMTFRRCLTCGFVIVTQGSLSLAIPAVRTAG